MKSCAFCGNEVAAHVCPKCGGPQPVDPREDYFSLLGVPKGFRHDLDDLEKRFYAISRTLHPDRFAAGGDTKWKTISVERMSAVNQAYQTLTKRESLRNYLLELEGIAVPSNAGERGAEKKPAQIPMELAEEWFDLQDAVMEAPETAVAKLAEFERGLRGRSDDLKKRIQELEEAYDREPSREVLVKIEKLALDSQYLKSMDRDLLRLKSRLGI